MAWEPTGCGSSTRASRACAPWTSTASPRWRPPFIKSLRGDDRCHLNGLALVDGPAEVRDRVFGQGRAGGGWRPERYTGGIVMDVASGQIVATGLSMPHSPRFYGNQLWVLDSGRGSMAMVERSNGNVRAIASSPDLTRGLDFAGNLAFVGLSQMRKKNRRPRKHSADCIGRALFGGRAFRGIVILDLATGSRKPSCGSIPE
jgi:uncharacterized protein (TIGR03032 family)